MNYGVKATKKRIRAVTSRKKKYANRLFLTFFKTAFVLEMCIRDRGKAVFNRIASRVVVGRIVNFLIDDRLNLRILRGVNLQSAAEQKIGRLRVSIAELLFERFGDLADQLVRVIGCLLYTSRCV